ncbi:MAG: hypothetical protein ACI9IV_001707 [Paracoccaceae bacterium]
MAVGFGRSRTALSKQAGFKTSEIGFGEVIFCVIVSIIFGGIGWIIGAIFDSIF